MTSTSIVPADKWVEITETLDNLEREEEISILWACESGSRAWGFASQDSDFDVRFIYLRKTKEYVRASSLRDVIERPISADLDVSGWDLPKALGLLRKSNPPLLEWLQSPIVYRKNEIFCEKIKDLVPSYFSPAACMYHYMSMAKRNRRNYLEKDEIKLKRYFYMLRPVLACMWIESEREVPPIQFQVLLNHLLPSGAIRDEINRLLVIKMRSNEVDMGPPIPLISEFIEAQMERFMKVTKKASFSRDWELLDGCFRELLFTINGASFVK